MNRNIKKIVSYYKRKTGTSDPFAISDQLGILYQICDLQFEGCYMFLKNHRYIFINQNLPEHEQRLVMAHELGHAILHRKENCYSKQNTFAEFQKGNRSQQVRNGAAVARFIPCGIQGFYY